MVWLISVPPLRRVTLSWQSNQTVSLPCPALLRRVPSPRHYSGDTPPSAIHGRGRLSRHPCRAVPYATPTLGLPKSHFVAYPKARHDTKPVGANSFTRGLWGCDKAQHNAPKQKNKCFCSSSTSAQTPQNATWVQAERRCPRSVAGVRESDAGGPNREQSVFGYFWLGRLPGVFAKSDPL